MKIVVLVVCVLCCFTFQGQAQGNDSLKAIHFFGTTYASRNDTIISMHQLKLLVRDDSLTFASFKKARRFKALEISLATVASVVFISSFVVETPAQSLGLLFGSGLFFGTGIVINQGAYSNQLYSTIQLYNQRLNKAR